MLKTIEVTALLEPHFPIRSGHAVAVNECRAQLTDILNRLKKLVVPETIERVDKLLAELDDFAVRVSIIGQVKAGKTALTNAVIGSANLLPSDVNPWTSVITSIHMNTKRPRGKNAVFSFFTTEEWDNMVEVGGHMGEVAQRANFEGEVTALRNQVVEVQRRTKARLGQNFEMLLNGYHSFCGFGPELVKKYVCLGDEDDNVEGRYADLTRSADLYIDHSDFSLPTVLCDTPGVNDPFLMREAVTLKNLANTDICVIALSAHQAFSTVDIGLIRILMALEHKQIILYVNRIDELQDADKQVTEIDGFIRELLRDQELPDDLPIVFGSAAWGELATSGLSEAVDELGIGSLSAFAEARFERLRQEGHLNDGAISPAGSRDSTINKTADLSGVYELQHIIMDKSARDVGMPFVTRIQQETLGLAQQATLYLSEASTSRSTLRKGLDLNELVDELDGMLIETDEACTTIANDLSNKVMVMMSAAFRDFMLSEKAKLTAHIEAKNNVADWSPDAEALRRDLNKSHDVFVDLAPRLVNDVFAKASEHLEQMYAHIMDDTARLFTVNPPRSVTPNTPVSLMRTMAVDMSAGWFTSMFAKMNLKASLKRFDGIAKAEMQTTLAEMKQVYVSDYITAVREQLHTFLIEHIQTIQNLSRLGADVERADILQDLGVDTEINQRLSSLEEVTGELAGLFKRPALSKNLENRTAA